MTEEVCDHEFRMEVNCVAHELGIRHGWSAASYAAKLAERALAEGNPEEYRFWSSVAVATTISISVPWSVASII
jgi:hypothetical protein